MFAEVVPKEKWKKVTISFYSRWTRGMLGVADTKLPEPMLPSSKKEEETEPPSPMVRWSEEAGGLAEFVVDLDQIVEPMIADPDVHNDDPSRRYTHDTIRPISFYGGDKPVDLGFVGSCMVHKGDMKIIAQMLRNIEKQNGTVEFKAPLVVAPPTYNIVDELKAEANELKTAPIRLSS